jgi:hypothetical protein
VPAQGLVIFFAIDLDSVPSFCYLDIHCDRTPIEGALGDLQPKRIEALVEGHAELRMFRFLVLPWVRVPIWPAGGELLVTRRTGLWYALDHSYE